MTRRALLFATAAAPLAFAGLDSKKAAYVGGTWTGVKEGTEGTLDTSADDALKFTTKKGVPQSIPYNAIKTLEYGQKAGRRVGATVALGVTTLGIGALPMLFSKKRKHYLTIGYAGTDGKEHGVVLELGKNITRQTLTVMEARSGKQIEYESDEAKKHVGN